MSNSNSVDFSIAFLRAVIKHRPIGAHKHFAMLAMHSMILSELGRDIATSVLWETLEQYYNLAELDSLVCPSLWHE